MIEALGVRVRAGGAELLAGVTLSAAPGRVLAVLGPNGAGKSTLLKVLAGERRPDAGMVELDGRSLASYAPRELAQRRAVMPQSATLSFPFTAEEVALLGRLPHPRSPRHDGPIARRALAAAGVAHLAERSYATLSGGERQRVQLARVLAQIEPTPGPTPAASRVLLLDEPTAGLDLSHQHSLMSLARRLAGAGVAVIAVLHDLGLGALYADDVALLERGHVRAWGPPREVLDEGLVGEVFALDVQMVRAALPRRASWRRASWRRAEAKHNERRGS